MTDQGNAPRKGTSMSSEAFKGALAELDNTTVVADFRPTLNDTRRYGHSG
jgi:hypothetical protein